MLSCTFNKKKENFEMIHQNAHGLIKLAILIWLTNLLVKFIKLPTYLFTYLCPT